MVGGALMFWSQRKQQERRIQTLGEMVAYSLTSEATRTSWQRENGALVNSVLGITVPEYVFRDGITVRNRRIPLENNDEGVITSAARAWRKWDDECCRADAMVAFADAFEQFAASAIEARSGETTKIGSTEGESATRQGDAQPPSGPSQ
jgi:hypothetical protein